VALMLETTVQLQIPFDGTIIYFIAFAATVLFYNYPYARNYSVSSKNPRAIWHIRHHDFILINQLLFSITVLILVFLLFKNHSTEIRNIDGIKWLLLLIFPVAGALYYGANFLSKKYNLRLIGWLKPFIIGFVWAGMANIYPVLYYDILHFKHFEFLLYGILLFLKNFMFISMLAILFDVKDYAADSKSRLNTLVVKIGLRKTIFYIVIPLTILGLLTFISYAVANQFNILKMILIMIPFFLLLVVARSLRRRRPLMYYLVIIDGLIIVKGLFGILSTLV
jgi:hypothetical protein